MKREKFKPERIWQSWSVVVKKTGAPLYYDDKCKVPALFARLKDARSWAVTRGVVLYARIVRVEVPCAEPWETGYAIPLFRTRKRRPPAAAGRGEEGP